MRGNLLGYWLPGFLTGFGICLLLVLLLHSEGRRERGRRTRRARVVASA